MEEETKIQEDDLLQDDLPEIKPLEEHEPKTGVKEINPKSAKWLWLFVLLIFIFGSFGFAWYILSENEKLTNEIESNYFLGTERLTKRAIKGIGDTLSEAKSVLEKIGDEDKQKEALYIGKRNIYNQIEDWEAYTLIEKEENQQLLLGDSCGNEQQDAALAKLAEGDVYELDWNGPNLLYVANIDGLSNAEFSEWRVNCSAGGVYPLHANKDKLLFLGVCSSGAIPEKGSPDYEEFTSCIEGEQVVKAFFMKE